MATRTDKRIKEKGKEWSIEAICHGIPTKDVSIAINLNKRLRQSEVKSEIKKIESQLMEWFLDSKKLFPEHFIKIIRTPSYKHNKEVPMVFIVDVSVMTKRVIEMGVSNNSFKDVFLDELHRLQEYLELSKE